MKIYVTSKNSGPSWSHETKSVLYIGIDSLEALKAVGDFARHHKTKAEWPTRLPYLYSAIPEAMPRKMLEFFESDGWWYSIVQIDIQEPNTTPKEK